VYDWMSARTQVNRMSLLCSLSSSTFYGTPEHTRVYKCEHIFTAFRWLICQQFSTYFIYPAHMPDPSVRKHLIGSYPPPAVWANFPGPLATITYF